MGFLSRYTGTDIIDLGDGYNITIKQHLSGDCQERAEAAKVVAVAQASTDSANKKVSIETSTNVAAYTEVLLSEAVVAWNLTDEYDRLLPLEPKEEKLKSIRLLPGSVRALLRDKIEDNIKNGVRSPDDQKIFRPAGDVSPQE